MAFHPKIDSPCPYKANLADVMEGDFCRMCKRTVVDINAMNDDERLSFLSSCEEEVCVSYKMPAVRAAVIAAALLAPLPLAAQETAPAPATTQADEMFDDMAIIVGGIKDPKATAKNHKKVTKTAEQAEDANLGELPVIVESKESPAASNGKASK